MQTETINVTIEADPVTMLKIQRFLGCLHFDTRRGHSATLAMDIDGDGSDRVTVSGIDIDKFADESAEGTYMRRKRALVEWISAEPVLSLLK